MSHASCLQRVLRQQHIQIINCFGSEVVRGQCGRSRPIKEREQSWVVMGVLGPSFVALPIGILVVDEVDEIIGQISTSEYDVQIRAVVLVEIE